MSPPINDIWKPTTTIVTAKAQRLSNTSKSVFIWSLEEPHFFNSTIDTANYKRHNFNMSLKNLISRVLLVAALSFTLNSVAAERLATLYIESYNELQRQLTLGTEIFEAPQLAAAPLLLNAALPAMNAVDPDKPIALHLLELDNNSTEGVFEVTPAGELEALLRMIAGIEDNDRLAPPENNIYLLGKDMAARLAGGRLFFYRGKNHTLALADGLELLPAMPAMPGALRISIAPATLASRMDGLMDQLNNMNNVAVQTTNPETLEAMVKFYQNQVKQIAEVHLGIAIQQEGLFIRSRTAPVAESDLAQQIVSAQPLEPSQLALISKDAMINYASGKTTLQPDNAKASLDFWISLIENSNADKKGDIKKLTDIWANLMQLAGAPYAYTVDTPAEKDTPLPLRGFIQYPQAEDFVTQQNQLLESDEIQALFKEANPDSPPLPLKRTHNNIAIFNLPGTFNEESFKENLLKNLPAEMGEEEREKTLKRALESARNSAKLFSYGYDYAALKDSLIFGMGNKEQIEQVIAERQNQQAAPSAAATRIEELISPSGKLHTIGSLSIAKLIVSFATDKKLIDGIKEQPAGEGILFGSWRIDDEMLGVTLLTPSEIKVISTAIQAQAQARDRGQQGRRRGGGRRRTPGAEAAPTRPPIPPGF